MASIGHLLSRIPKKSSLNRFLINELLLRRNYVKTLYEDALTIDNNTSSGAVFESQLINGNVFTNPAVEYGSRRYYRGRIKGVIFDWGGTVVDCGVCAPIYTFVELFKAENVEITEDEARAIFGSNRKANIAQILDKEAVRKRWFTAKDGTHPTSDDVDRMYDKFVPQVLMSLQKYSNVIDGVTQTVKQLKKAPYNLKIGSTTGYPKQVLNTLLHASASQGFTPDASVCLGEVPEANPSPFMLWLCATRLQIFPIESIIKVDDSMNGIYEGLLAGSWTVGVAKTSSYVGLNEQQLEELTANEMKLKLNRAYEALSNSGAHYVIDTIKDLPSVIDDINRRLANGEKP